MTSHCDAVAERLALGESLEPLAEHVAGCAACARLVETSRKLGAARAAIDPGLGFSARMTAGAQQRFAARRRLRVAAGMAATVAAGALGVFVFTRTPAAPSPQLLVGVQRPSPEEPPPPPSPEAAADDVELLVNLAGTERSSPLSASWKELERPLRAYRKLVNAARGEAVEGESP
jgi:hypothetical protein